MEQSANMTSEWKGWFELQKAYFWDTHFTIPFAHN